MFQKLKFNDIGIILRNSFCGVKAKLLLNLLLMSLVSVVVLVAVYIMSSSIEQGSAIFSILLTAITFAVVNLVIATLIINNQVYQSQLTSIKWFAHILEEFKRCNLLPLIILLTMLEIIPNLVFSYIAPLINSAELLQLAGILLQLIVFALCIIGVFALILNVRTNGEFKLFLVIKLAIQFILKNILILIVLHVITVILFLLVNFAFSLIDMKALNIALSMVVVFGQFIANLILIMWSVILADNCLNLIVSTQLLVKET